MTKPYKVLRERMTPEAQERAAERTAAMLQGCASESDCQWQPWCRIEGRCKRDVLSHCHSEKK